MYKMNGFSGFGNASPMKNGKKVSEYATKKPKIKTGEKGTSGKYGVIIDRVKDAANNISEVANHVTKKHNIYKGKKLTLKGQVNMPDVKANWNSGNPNVKIGGSGNLSAKYNITKNISANAGINFNTRSGPKYRAGLNISL